MEMKNKKRKIIMTLGIFLSTLALFISKYDSNIKPSQYLITFAVGLSFAGVLAAFLGNKEKKNE